MAAKVKIKKRRYDLYDEDCEETLRISKMAINCEINFVKSILTTVIEFFNSSLDFLIVEI